jgi:hypothetical protein
MQKTQGNELSALKAGGAIQHVQHFSQKSGRLAASAQTELVLFVKGCKQFGAIFAFSVASKSLRPKLAIRDEIPPLLGFRGET